MWSPLKLSSYDLLASGSKIQESIEYLQQCLTSRLHFDLRFLQADEQYH